jgi:uncharacterized membrane protein
VDATIEFLGRLHPALVHFPVALILAACAAEMLYVVKKEKYFAAAALFSISAGAWMSLPAFVIGFAAAAGESFGPELQGVFELHRIVGVTTPMLATVAAGMGHSTRRTGQVWEQIVYRVFLVVAAVSVLLAGAFGGQLVHGADYLPW